MIGLQLISRARVRMGLAQLSLAEERSRGEAADKHKCERLQADIERERAYIADRMQRERVL